MINKGSNKRETGVVTIIQSSIAQTGKNRCSIKIIKRKSEKAKSCNTHGRSAIILNDSPTRDYADCNTRRALAVAVNSVLRVPSRESYGYLLAQP